MHVFRCSLILIASAFAASAQDAQWQSLEPVTTGIPSGQSEITGDAIVCTPTSPYETAWFPLPGEYWDFELELEFFTPSPANGGVLVRGHQMPLMHDTNQTTFYGYQINLDTTGRGDVGSIIEEHERGVLMRPAISAFQTIDPNAWNTVNVRAVGNIIEVRLNGETAGRLNDERFIGGTIALQARPERGAPPAAVHYRNVRVRDLGRTGNWRSLFNGKTLDGWKKWGEEDWSVNDGVIQGRRGPKESEGYLATVDTWDDFRVRGQFKMLGDGNYGLFYHSTIRLREEDGYPLISGVQGEVMPGRPAQTGRLYESYRRGWLMPQDHADIGSWAVREGEWNEIEIRNEGNHVTTWVNGIRVVDFNDETPQLFKGSFALQLHTGEGAGIDWRELHVIQRSRPAE